MTEQDLKPWDAAYTDAYGPTYSTKKAPALSRVPRGHWRNRWRAAWPLSTIDADQDDGSININDFEYYGRKKYPSREIAEHEALHKKSGYGDHDHDIWIDAEFFPES